jgi:hypothetical protein
MKNNIFGIVVGFFLVSGIVFCANEFVIPKKKKEIAVHVKEDLATLLEQISRQIGTNIVQAIGVQNQILDKIKELFGDVVTPVPGLVCLSSCSTEELKKCRDELQKYLQILEQQQVDLQRFLSSFAAK